MLPQHLLNALSTLATVGIGPQTDTARLPPQIDSIYQNALALSQGGSDASAAAANAMLQQIKVAAAPLLLGSDDDGEGGVFNQAKWQRFVSTILDEFFKVLDDMIQLAKDHPDYVLAAILAIAAPHLCAGVIVPILEYVGFTSTGILAGQFTRTLCLNGKNVADSLAFALISGSTPAAVQGLIGNITPHSLFAILQSAGMNGYGGAVISMFIRTHALEYLVARGLYDSWGRLWGGSTEDSA